MSISDREYDGRLSFGTRVNSLVVLIAISMIIFVVLAFFKAITYIRFPEGSDVSSFFDKNILSWFALSPNVNSTFSKPWTLLTCSLVNIGFWQLFANMLWLWCFGYIFIDLTGNRKLIPVFIYGTLAGTAGFLITERFLQHTHIAQNMQYFFGSGPAILAICMATLTISPNYKLFPMLGGGISLWIIGILYLAIDMATLPASYPAIHIAHLAGGLAGFLFIFILRKGFDGSEWMNNIYDWFINLFEPGKNKKHNDDIKKSFFYQAQKQPYTKRPDITQQRLDEILDKINISGGYDKLSEEEKEFLKNASQDGIKN